MKNKIFLLVIFFALAGHAQTTVTNTPTRSNPLSTEKWLKDATTFSLESPVERKEKRNQRLQRRIDANSGKKNKLIRRQQQDWMDNSLNGVRIIFEPQVGTLFQRGINKIETPNITSLGKIGLESNLYKGFVALQALIIYPSRVQYDAKSEYRLKGYTVDSLGWVGVDVGFSMGLSFFDGILAAGYCGLFFDKRDFKNTGTRLVYQNNFIYLNVQVLSAIKAVLKGN